jgi:hypothetical protein
MPTQCSRDLFGYEVVEGRQVVAAFDGGIAQRTPGRCCSARQVAHSASLTEALPVLAQEPTDAIFISVNPDGGTASTEFCGDLVGRANGRPVVALIDVACRTMPLMSTRPA